MRQMGADKSYADLYDLFLRVMRRAGTLDNQAIQILLLIAGILLVYLLWRRVDDGTWQIRKPLCLMGWCVLVYAVYLIALWGTYSFTLTLLSARELVGFQRYNSTCALFLYGCACCIGFVMAERMHMPLRTLVALLLLAPMLIPSWTVGLPRLFRETYHVPMRSQMEMLAQKRPLRADETAVVIIGPDDNLTLAHYMARYVFWNAQIMANSVQLLQPADVVYVMEPSADGVTFGDVEIVTMDR